MRNSEKFEPKDKGEEEKSEDEIESRLDLKGLSEQELIKELKRRLREAREKMTSEDLKRMRKFEMRGIEEFSEKLKKERNPEMRKKIVDAIGDYSGSVDEIDEILEKRGEVGKEKLDEEKETEVARKEAEGVFEETSREKYISQNLNARTQEMMGYSTIKGTGFFRKKFRIITGQIIPGEIEDFLIDEKTGEQLEFKNEGEARDFLRKDAEREARKTLSEEFDKERSQK